MRLARKTRVFRPLVLVAFLGDCMTKRAVVETLGMPGASHEVLDEAVRDG